MAVPPTVVTITSTADPVAVPAGADILIVVGLVVIPVAATPPKVTVAPVRFVPVMLTNVPADSGPAVGEMTVTVGAATYVYTPDPVAVPFGVTMSTLTSPAPWNGVTAMIAVAFSIE